MSSKSLLKAEDPADYASRANEGIILGHPVKINGQHNRGDNGVQYHSTIKYFDVAKDHPHAIHNLAQHLPLNPPDAKNTQIEPGQFKDRNGNDVYVLKLKGNSADKLKEHNGKFAGMGFPSTFEWIPHISVDKETHDRIKNSGAKTVHEAGIEFGPAQLKHGKKVLKTYHHEPDSAEPKVPDESDFTAKATAKSEEIHGEKPLMKPYVSEAQRRWAHTPTGKKALGGNAGVHEWDEATKDRKLPEKVGKSESLQKGLRGDWQKEGHTLKIGYGKIRNKLGNVMGEDKNSIHITAHDKSGVQIGHAKFLNNGSHLIPDDKNGEPSVVVWPTHKRKGLASAMYSLAEKHTGLKTRPSKTGQTLAGNNFLNRPHKSFGKSESLEKGALKNAGIALGMAGALAGAHTSDAKPKVQAGISHSKPHSPSYDHKKMLNAIAQVESSGGTNVNHKPTSNGDTAYGKWALMPNTIKDTINGHKDLKAKHAKALALKGEVLHRYMADHKGLEEAIADRHLSHIEHNFKNNPDQIGFAWNQGITGTKKAKSRGIDVSNHPYTKKIRDAYSKGK